MRFSIVTASFQQFGWLRRCVRSVADQGVKLEHLIQDAGTGSELKEWVGAHSSAKLTVEKDGGMYDALNRALKRASGDVCGILNCDEQYLPGTLQRVAETFQHHPEADIVAGDFLIVDPGMQLLAFRKITPLRRSMILTDHLYAFTCAFFFRRRIFESGFQFDTSYRIVGDGEWMARILGAGFRAIRIRQYLAAFTFTGLNQSVQAQARAEEHRLRSELPIFLKATGPVLKRFRHVEKLLTGAYWSSPIEYDLYAGDDDQVRSHFVAQHPKWRNPW